jgi:hypothetical protein
MPAGATGVAERGGLSSESDDEEFNLASSRLDTSICFRISDALPPVTPVTPELPYLPIPDDSQNTLSLRVVD